MAKQDVTITGITPDYHDLAVTIGGTHLNNDTLSGLTLTAEAFRAPRLTLDVLVYDASTVSGEMNVLIPDETRATLVALGWTPPADE
jgi:hypothetical protein